MFISYTIYSYILIFNLTLITGQIYIILALEFIIKLFALLYINEILGESLLDSLHIQRIFLQYLITMFYYKKKAIFNFNIYLSTSKKLDRCF